MNRKNRKQQLTGLLLTIMICVTGCGKGAAFRTDPGHPSAEERAREAAESRVELEENRNRQSRQQDRQPHILIDDYGYGPQDQKTAYFIGEDLADTFWVVDAESRTRVLEGALFRVKEDKDGRSIWKGDFSPLSEEGSYYIQTAVIGQSDVFAVSQDMPKTLAALLGDEWEKRMPYLAARTDEEQFCQNASGLMSMAVAFEIYEQDSERSRHRLAESAEKMRAAGKELLQEKEPKESMLAEYAAAMAVAADVLRDSPEFEELKKEALTAYGMLEAKGKKDVGMLTAEAALYRLTGDRRYAEDVQEYLAGLGTYDKDNFCMAYCYLTTPKDVDIEICNSLMKKLIKAAGERTDELAAGAPALYGQGREVREEWDEELLSAGLLTLADYVLVSREYRRSASEICHRLSLSGFLKPEDMTGDELAKAYLLALAMQTEDK